VFAIARFFGWTDEYVLEMPSDRFNKAFNYMQILKSQEQLKAFECISYPKMSKNDRKDLFKRTKEIAIPNELNPQPIYTTKQAEQQFKRAMRG
jgi:hypothetical protein